MVNRREFLMSIAVTLIPKIIRVDTASSGTWAGINRSTYPQFSSIYGGAGGGGKSCHLSVQEIMAIWDKYTPKIRDSFERDENFYRSLVK